MLCFTENTLTRGNARIIKNCNNKFTRLVNIVNTQNIYFFLRTRTFVFLVSLLFVAAIVFLFLGDVFVLVLLFFFDFFRRVLPWLASTLPFPFPIANVLRIFYDLRIETTTLLTFVVAQWL